MRLVSLTCSNTEIVAALGCSGWLVGVDDHSDHPAEVVSRLPRVGPDLGVDVARVAALEPDLVLGSLTVPGHEKVVAALEAAGLPHIAPAPVSLADIYRDIRDIAGRLDVPERGEELVGAMEMAIEIRGTASGGPRILVEWWPKPVIVPGRKSWVTDLIAAAGGVNPLVGCVAGDDVESRAVTPDEARELAPDAVVISWCGVEPEKYRPQRVASRQGWAEIPAIRAGQIHCIPEAWLGRPGPRLVEGYQALRRIIENLDSPGISDH